MVVLVGYSDAGRRIVVVVCSGRMSLSGQPHVIASSCHDIVAGPSGDMWGVSLSLALNGSSTVDILCCCELPELFLDCDTYVYDIMKLMMYLISRWIN